MNPVTRRPVVRENQRVETIQRPGREIYNQTFVQPIIQRENVNLRINRGDDKQIQLDNIQEPVQVNNIVRNETV